MLHDKSDVHRNSLKDELYLMQRARKNVQILTNALYDILNDAKTKTAIVLPEPLLQLPREKPLPEAKPLTRWEKFAAAKGIVKKKRSKMVWDEDRQQWAPRYGYGRANDPKDKLKNWLVEVKPGDDPNVDPFEEKAEARKAARNKQKMQEERNRLEAAHAAGLTSRGKSIANFDRANSDKKAYLEQGIRAAQSSTASIGRFDPQLENEPSRMKGKRRNYTSDTVNEHRAEDLEKSRKLATQMFPEASSNASKRAESVRSSSKTVKLARADEETRNRKAKIEKKTLSKRGKPALSGKSSGVKGKGKAQAKINAKAANKNR